jgi:hypothetical protein
MKACGNIAPINIKSMAALLLPCPTLLRAQGRVLFECLHGFPGWSNLLMRTNR